MQNSNTGKLGTVERLRPPLLPLLLAALFLLTGCTSQMWQDDRFARLHQPAPASNLRLYYSERRQDILVTYDEAKWKTGSTRQRCYWAERSNALTLNGKKPHFVSQSSQPDLRPIPLEPESLQPPISEPAELHAVVATNGQSFTVYSGDRALADYRLPSYYDRRLQYAERALLLPATATVDAAAAGVAATVITAPYSLQAIGEYATRHK